MVTCFFVQHTVSVVASPGTIISCHAKKKAKFTKWLGKNDQKPGQQLAYEFDAV